VYYLLKLSVSLITVLTEQDGFFFENNMPFVIHSLERWGDFLAYS